AGEGQNMFAVAKGEETRLFALEEFLDHDFVPGIAEGAAEQRFDRGVRLVELFGDDDAFALRQSIGLDPDRQGQCPRERFCFIRMTTAAIGGGRNAVFGAQILDESLGCLQPRGLRSRPQRFDSERLETVGEARDQWRFGADNGEIDSLIHGKGDEALERHRADGHAFGDVGDAGVPWRAIEVRDQRAGAERPGQRVLASARTDEKDVQPNGFPMALEGCIIGAWTTEPFLRRSRPPKDRLWVTCRNSRSASYRRV